MNLVNTAQSVLVANAMLAGATNNGLVGFFTDTKGGGSSFTLTAREMLDYFIGGGDAGIYGPSAVKYGIDATPQGVMMKNLKQNWPNMVMAGIGIPVAFTVGKKLLGKSILRPARKMLKATGLDVTV
tara:strand:+ start:825 stop:1205 length:381 start_codon:yes stop_codon:yes gene_type:complete